MIKQVLVVRKDLNMRKGKIAAQCAHASLGTVTKYITKTLMGNYNFYPTPVMEEWLYGGPFTKIVVSVDSEEALLTLEKRCKEKGIHNCLIQDAGKTEFSGVPTYTVLAVGPDHEEKVNELTGDLPLL